MRGEPQDRRLAVMLLGCALGAGVLLAASMVLYPGGTWMDAQAHGHDFFRNFVCDLTQPVALNGVPNRGARPAQAGMLLLVGAFLPFWWLMPRLFPEEAKLGQWVRAAGMVSLAGLVAVPLLPSLVFGKLHAAAVLVASVPALVAGWLSVRGLRARPRLQVLGTATVAAALVDAALYARGVVLGGPTLLALPALQKVAATGLLGWMVGVAVVTLRRVTATP
ncbi:hypothetical protein [Chondromyces apiculatus]|uniref:DUF998 domain-containing protein n=1 Tax=Chondromyces apiculatus DSM 436 TaxID=1192034 RepID=A0A017TAY8_9BACT|nr:hypothetical protein [Chondromyces apiculatus]EYF06453.1 Hypothetical protein CAP_1983 [Chondromyces apiculatus DSM 436]